MYTEYIVLIYRRILHQKLKKNKEPCLLTQMMVLLSLSDQYGPIEILSSSSTKKVECLTASARDFR